MDFIENFSKTIQAVDGFHPGLCRGASDKQLAATENELKVLLPDDFKKFYRIYNGQDPYSDILFGTFTLSSLGDLLESFRVMRDMEQDVSDIRSEPEPGIQSFWCSSLWIPFASTADGHALCMDFAPAKNGTMGQIITFWYNSPDRQRIAPSFRSFIEDYTQKIKDKIYIYKQETYNDILIGGIVRADDKPMFGGA